MFNISLKRPAQVWHSKFRNTDLFQKPDSRETCKQNFGSMALSKEGCHQGDRIGQLFAVLAFLIFCAGKGQH
jgi:hypothetical protein